LKKRIAYLTVLLCITFTGMQKTVVAQDNYLTLGNPQIQNLPKYDLAPYHFGFVLAINQMDFTIHRVPDYKPLDSLCTITSTPQWGFNIGIISNLRLGTYLDLRFVPTLSFGTRTMNYSIMQNHDSVLTIYTKNVESTYLDFPLLLKYRSKRINNFAAYVIGGFQYSFDLASQANKEQKPNQQYVLKLKEKDVLYQMGVGFDFYTEYFKFAVELKMSYGLFDLLQHDNTIYTQGIERLNSKIFQLSFLFE
jgi:hypothetical protein